MEEKIGSILLICLVALSIVYVCNSTALSSHATKSIDTAPSKPIILTEDSCQNRKLSYPEPIPVGDPIDNPIPHKH
jgi:hypothetical protein